MPEEKDLISGWEDNFGLKAVNGKGINGANFLSSESVLVCAGPAIFKNVNSLTPIGFVENASVNQSKQLQQLFEIGSRKPFIIPGRTQVSASLSRVLFNGASLMKVLYNNGDVSTYAPELADMPIEHKPASGDFQEIENTAGAFEGDFYINLASEFFNAPVGLAFVMRDMKQDAYEGFFLEECWIQGHQFSMAAQQTVLLENVSMRATGVIPISKAQIGG
ncbi:hypothetical protein H8D85_01055 [bacterium]|nr:hypothetical protein [bacterium]